MANLHPSLILTFYDLLAFKCICADLWLIRTRNPLYASLRAMLHVSAFNMVLTVKSASISGGPKSAGWSSLRGGCERAHASGFDYKLWGINSNRHTQSFDSVHNTTMKFLVSSTLQTSTSLVKSWLSFEHRRVHNLLPYSEAIFSF